MPESSFPWTRRVIPLAGAALALVFLAASSGAWGGQPGCLRCHEGIEPIRAADSGMMEAIARLGTGMGDPAGCVVCHGGNPSARTKAAAHGGKFYPDPGSPWINDATCGRCHMNLVRAQWRSLMMTESGKIQGTAWSAGGLEGYDHRWANYDVENPADPHQRLGTEAYRAYKDRLAALFPNAYPRRQEKLPPAPDPSDVARSPEQAAFTYLRVECERCHLGVRGRQKRGDYRGMGCSACHMPYSNEGLYEGADRSIPRDEPGHILVHSIQATREAKVTVHGTTYSGVPVETCTTCHDRGKRIGTSFQGLMETAYTSPWAEDGSPQPALHTKHYIAMQEDIHYQKGMMCQDCHTTLDLHGDNTLAGTTMASVEIECTDCHGTPDRYPWELPMGYGDEFGQELAGVPRGTARALLPGQDMGTVYPPEDGYLISARGNPLGNAVRRGDQVVVHTAGGKDLEIKPLKLLADTGALSVEARVAMVSIGRHMERMECYSCHARWAPQCYGCHVKIDYSNGKKHLDWVAAGQRHAEAGHRADRGEDGSADLMIPGHVTEQRSYLRFEDPALGVNGEGRITPIAPGCQVVYTIIAPDGSVVVRNKIFRTPAGTEGGGADGQLSLDMAPMQPHTTGRARSCESCHASSKAAGYGIEGGTLTRPWDRDVYVDLATADGKVLAEAARPQRAAIDGLTDDWSRIVDEAGRQLMTVGHHFPLSRPLNDRERALLDRRGVCLACHHEIPAGSLAVNILHHVAEATGQLPVTAEQHGNLLHKVLLTAGWSQVGGAALVLLLVLLLLVRWLRR